MALNDVFLTWTCNVGLKKPTAEPYNVEYALERGDKAAEVGIREWGRWARPIGSFSQAQSPCRGRAFRDHRVAHPPATSRIYEVRIRAFARRIRLLPIRMSPQLSPRRPRNALWDPYGDGVARFGFYNDPSKRRPIYRILVGRIPPRPVAV